MKLATDIMLSNHHCHLTEEAANVLFGEAGVSFKSYTNDSRTEWAANETVIISGPRGSIANVRVLGPCRQFVQAELLYSDNYKLGLQAPVKMSGDLEGAATVKISGPCGEIEAPCAILAQRHIHVGYEDAADMKVKDNSRVSVRISGVRGLQFDNVVIRVSKRVARDMMMHIDIEEGNAAGIVNHSEGEVIVPTDADR